MKLEILILVYVIVGVIGLVTYGVSETHYYKLSLVQAELIEQHKSTVEMYTESNQQFKDDNIEMVKRYQKDVNVLMDELRKVSGQDYWLRGREAGVLINKGDL